jgi:RND family efflux transporter MFP subunit
MSADPERSADQGRTAGAAHDLEAPLDKDALPKIRTRSVAVTLALLLCVFAALFLVGWIPRRERLRELQRAPTAEEERPSVEVAPPKTGVGSVDLRLPADVRSMQQTSIYARANGYLKKNLVDIGDKVDAGQLLAEIDAPDVEAEVVRATASVALTRSNVSIAQDALTLADTTLKRYTGITDNGAVTKQQIDERQAAFTQAKLALEAAKSNQAFAEADLKRLQVLEGFEHVTAPFAGTISARNFDPGALLSPTNTGEGHELFRIDRTDTLRVFVNVPQAYATAVRTGQEAFLTVRNHSGREFAGKVARSAGVVDPSTRTLRVQVDVPNGDGALYSGMYGEMRLPTASDHAPLLVATSALVFGPEGTFVWVVQSDQVHKKTVGVGRDLGTEIEIVSGLDASDSVVKNPGERLVEGLAVRRSAEAPKAEGKGDGNGGGRAAR